MTPDREVPAQVRRWHALYEREQELGRQKTYTNEILNALDDVFYVLDANGDLERWNDRLTEVTGYSDREVASMNALEFFGDEDTQRVADALEKTIDDGRNRLAVDLLTKAGTPIPFEFVGVELEDARGRPVVAGIGRDVSERNRLATELRTEKEHFRVALENSPMVAFRLDTDLRYTWISSPHPDFRPEDVLGKRDDELLPTAAAETVMAPKRQVLETGTGVREVVTYEVPSGAVTYDLIIEPLRDESGTIAGLTCAALDITDRTEHEQVLERTSDLLRQTQRLAGVGGWELDLRSDPPYSGMWTDELYRIHELPLDTVHDMERGIEFYHPGDRDRIRTAVTGAIEDGEGYDLEARLITAAGNVRWVRTIGTPVFEGDRLVALRGSLQDVTAQKHHELALQSLHDATRGLLNTESQSDTAALVVDVAADVLDLPGVAMYLLDTEMNEFEPVVTTPAFDELCDDPPPVAIGDEESPIWNTFVTGTGTVLDPSDRSDGSHAFGDDRSGLLVPIGDHGVFVAVSDDPTVDDATRQLVETLVATTVAAFDRLRSESNLEQRDAELEARNENLTRQVAINELLRTIDRSLVRATSRDGIEAAVCEQLVESDGIEFAWIGDVESDGRDLVPRTWHGTTLNYLDAIAVDGRVPIDEPAWQTARTDESTVVSNVVEGMRDEPWRGTALSFGFRSLIAVPLVYDEYSYGVLAVYATEQSAFSDLERNVFEELGETIASSINAVETRRGLHSSTTLQLKLRFTDADSFMMQLARDANARVRYDGLVAASDDETQLFVTVTGAAAETIETSLDDLVSVTEHRCISSVDGDHRFEIRARGPVVAAKLVRHGGSPQSIVAAPDGAEVVVEVPIETDVREFVEMLGEQFPTVELVSRHDVERSTNTERELVDALSDRQQEVLNAAYFGGFFEWPRESTGEEIAEMLGVSQPTVNRHLRLGQKELLSRLFGDR
ncbi:bacterio-opsin activator domain-containing protein [Halosolutus halophilus]|uniref:bacterio-opsin activator domain-containing protein n=1 Tax=Halosolutus halophilus TaxID=1552990 RepID=UPI00223517AD|nr:bacterio-opsin activator domain-containing protein [Halosolutus halophilus]